MNREVSELSRAVNNEARSRYPALARKLGDTGFVAAQLPRLALRRDTSYPYKFAEDDSFYPKNEFSFGRVIQATRAEGLKEIHSTITEQSNEHGWLFVPELCAWIDITHESDMSSVMGDQYLKTFISYMFDDIEDVHTHPDHAARTLAQEAPWEFSQHYLLEAARPSSQDQLVHAQTKARTSPTTNLTSGVISHYGITTFAEKYPKSLSNGFETRGYGPMAREATSNPTKDIELLLARVAANAVSYVTEETVFKYNFEPLS